MFKLKRALKKYRDAGCLNEQINLFGFIGDHTFLTKNGDLGVMLGMRGVDYECLTANEIDFDHESGVYVVPKIIDSGYLVVGKKRVTFNRQRN